MNQYPIELTHAPVPVVALAYLPEVHATMSSSLNEVFDSCTVLSFPNEQALPLKKMKRNYDAYKPVGIMKRDWMRKHQERIPSVIIILVEWKPDQSNWKEQEQQITAQVERMKRRAINRNIKFLLMIVTKVKPKDLVLASSENEEVETLKVDDFLYSLKKSCAMDSNKHIQLIEEEELSNPLVLHSKIGKVLQELSGTYYRDHANRVKKLKGEVSPSSQPHLFARHRYKVAFYTEISLRGFTKQTSNLTATNNAKVLKYLSQAYSYLMAVLPKDHGVSENEIKTFGDIINFKVCQMKLSDKKTVDQGVKQFLKHIAWYKQINIDHKRRNLMFKHCSLTYRQYRMFAEMLDALPVTYLRKDDNYHNPGYYFQAAAAQAKFRKIYAQKQCERYREAIQTLLAERPEFVEELRKDNEACYEGYYGQQLEKDPTSLLEPSMTINLRDLPSKAIFRDIAKEVMTVKHSEDIVTMLTKAYNHFKKHQTLKRLIYSIASNIAEEHFYSKEWDRATMFFDRIAKTYKKEQWYHLLTSVRQQSLVCAQHLNNPKDFLIILLDLISTQLHTTEVEQIGYYDDLLAFMNQTKDFGISPLSDTLVVDMDNKHVLVTMKLQFEKPFVCVYEPINLNIQFVCNSPKPLRFQKLQVRFSNKNYHFSLMDQQDLSTVFTYDQSKGEAESSHILDLTLKAKGAPTVFSFPMTIKEKQELEVENVSLYLIGQNNQQICFIWKMVNNRYFSTMLSNYDHRYEVGNESLFVERPVIKILEPKPKLDIKFESQPPALINEHYALKILLVSHGDSVIKGKLRLSQLMNVKPFYLEQEGELVDLPASGVDVESIAQNDSREVIVFLQCNTPGMIRVKALFDYEATLYPTLHQEAEVDIYVQYPFDATFSFMGSRSTGSGTFKPVPSQSISFFQKVINNAIQNVAVNDPRQQQSQTDSTQFRYNEGFPAQQQLVLSTILTCNTPYGMMLDRVQFIPVEQNDEQLPSIECCSSPLQDFEEMRKESEENTLENSKKHLDIRDSYTMCHVLKANVSGRSVRTGNLLITCHRQKPLIVHSADCNTIQYEVPLPSLNIYHRNLRATFESPSEAVLGKPFEVTLTIHNDSSTLQELQLQVGESEAFFFSGTTLLTFTILPFSPKTLTYIMIPVLTGNVCFPKFTVKANREQVHVLTERERWTIFVHML